MKPINRFLSTKIKNDSYLRDVIIPESPKFDEITAFFDSLGFIDLSEKFKNHDFDVDSFMRKEAKQSANPIYVYQKITHDEDRDVKTYWIRFCNCGTITAENPLLFTYASNDGELDEAHELLDIDYVAYDITNRKRYKTFNDFMDLMKKHFSF